MKFLVPVEQDLRPALNEGLMHGNLLVGFIA